MSVEQVCIIGSGPAGLTAAIYTARANLRPIVLEGGVPGGQLMWTSEVENFPGFPTGIKGSELMGNMRKQAERFGARLVAEFASSLDCSENGKLRIQTNSRVVEAQSVILAVGASHRWLGVPGEEELKNKGVSACATCDAAFFKGKAVVVVGGGDSAMEEATFLTKFARSVTLLVREEEGKLTASVAMVERAKKNEKIEFLYSTEVVRVIGDSRMTGVEVRGVMTGEKRLLDAQGMFVAIGLVPNTKFLEGVVKLARGYIDVHDFTRTSVEGVFAAGDAHDGRYRQAISAAGFGCMAGIDVERYLTDRA